jgi:hypothetical protein
MRDWKALAKANGAPSSGKELDRITEPLEALEESLRRLTVDLSPDLEPATSFRVEADHE